MERWDSLVGRENKKRKRKEERRKKKQEENKGERQDAQGQPAWQLPVSQKRSKQKSRTYRRKER